MNGLLYILTYSLKRVQINSKRLSAAQYFRNKLSNDKYLFLQETHSIFNDKNIWKNDFNAPLFYSHGTSQFCCVLIAYFGDLNFLVNKQVGNKNRHILILDVNIVKMGYVLVNIYNANTELEKELMKNINFLEQNCIILAGDLIVFFDSKLETNEGKPSVKQKSVVKHLELKEEYNLCDIWRIRNPTKNNLSLGKTILLVL